MPIRLMKGFKVKDIRVIMTAYKTGLTVIDIYKEGKPVKSEGYNFEEGVQRFKQLFNGYMWVWAR
jgi:hypothetical protein